MISTFRNHARVFGASIGVAAIILSACGKAATNKPAAAPPPSSSPSASPSQSPSVSPAPRPAGNPFSVGSATIAGIGLVLDNSKGFTLYHLTTDSSSKTSCTGGCAQVWPPLLSTNGKVPASPGVMGSFSLLKRPDGGLQVTYNGMPLYRYVGDSGPGQAHGQGIGNVWFAVKVA